MLRPRHSAGRWSLLYTSEILRSTRASLESTCWMLLKRYGVVFREMVARETIEPRWREVLIALRRLEDRAKSAAAVSSADSSANNLLCPSLSSLCAHRPGKQSLAKW